MPTTFEIYVFIDCFVKEKKYEPNRPTVIDREIDNTMSWIIYDRVNHKQVQ